MNFELSTLNPLVSIIIPTYNRAHLIGETLQSVLDQTYQNWECIVVDDLSTDNTDEVLKSWTEKDNRFKYFKRHREPKGAPTCRNIGLDKAEGEYVMFLDSDDLLADFCLERRVKKFKENQNCDFLAFQSVLFGDSLEQSLFLWNVETNESDLTRFLRTEPLWAICGALYKPNFIKDNNGFTESLPFLQDTELGMRLLLDKPKYKKYLQEKPDVYIRQDPQSLTRKDYFLGSGDIIKKRLEILNEISRRIVSENKTIIKEEESTFLSTIYFFSKYLLLEFGLKSDFNRNWLKSCKLFKKGFFRFFISLLYPYIIYSRKYSKYSIKAGQVYYRLFHNQLPDIDEMDKVKLHSVPYIKDANFRTKLLPSD